MGRDLKEQNVLPLTAILATILVVAALIQFGIYEVHAYLDGWKELGLAAAAAAVSGLLASLVPADWKQRLLFPEHRHALPGHRCHTLCQRDPRIDNDELVRRWPEVFSADVPVWDRNKRWYQRVYQPLRDQPEVRQAHRSFLLYRDAFGAALLLLLAAVGWKLFAAPSAPALRIGVIWALVVSVILLAIAARAHANRLVVNTVALAMGESIVSSERTGTSPLSNNAHQEAPRE